MSTSEVLTNLEEKQVTPHEDSPNDNDTLAVEEIPLRRSTRTRHPPERLDLTFDGMSVRLIRWWYSGDNSTDCLCYLTKHRCSV